MESIVCSTKMPAMPVTAQENIQFFMPFSLPVPGKAMRAMRDA